MRINPLYLCLIIPFVGSCQETPQIDSAEAEQIEKPVKEPIGLIDSLVLNYAWKKDIDVNNSLLNQIPCPEGFVRPKAARESYTNWLRHLPLSNDAKVYYFDGTEKFNQDVQHAVIDIDVGKQDLQQCADAVMRLRAEYLYAYGDYSDIHFNYTNGTNIPFNKWSSGYYPTVKGNKVNWTPSSKNNSSYSSFRKYMTSIYMYAGTASLEKELKAVELDSIQVGDIFIQGGHPGHAVIVVDVCLNEKTSEKCFLLAQSFMPAQSIHILKNKENPVYSPWYRLSQCQQAVVTPEWSFYSSDLMRFPK